MREILFRGKLHSGEWAYGNLVVSKNGIAIITPDDTPLGKYGQIASETVGQYTGLKDENGQRIFEGDILKDDWGKNYKVLYSTTSCSFMLNCENPPNEWEKGNYRIGKAWCDTIKVIGNIHDNPELLEEATP